MNYGIEVALRANVSDLKDENRRLRAEVERLTAEVAVLKGALDWVSSALGGEVR